MKRVLSLILCIVMIAGVFTSCTTLKKDEDGNIDKGAIIDVYLTNEIFNYDPAAGFTDASTAKILSLMYEGLTKLDSDGNWQKALMKDYVVSQDDEEGFKIQITLKDTKWSDSRTVQANDLIYAWKRILDPEFKCEAAALLYDIKNARDVKKGDASVDDLGVVALDTLVLEVEFGKKIDLDRFFTAVASIALVPLREDIISTNDNWAKKASTTITNGPFDIKEIAVGESMRLERSQYYYRDTEENEALDKYVIPYRIVTHYDYGTLNDQLDAFLSGDIQYLGELPVDDSLEASERSREIYKAYSNAEDIPVTHTYIFNENNAILKNADVRKALSMAIDREAIAELVKYAKAADGFIPYKVKGNKGEFRTEGGSLITTTADLSGAKSLLSKAGVTSGSFSITVRDDEVDYAVANAIKAVWEELGFTVKVRTLVCSNDVKDSTIIVDDFAKAYSTGDFDVIAVDMQMLTSDAYAALAPFAVEFSGNGVDMYSDDYTKYGHVCGYKSDDYNAIFDSVEAAADDAERTDLLHKAEEKLIEDGVVMPVFFEQDAFMFSSVLSGLDGAYFGRVFNGTQMKNYMEYKAALESEEAEALMTTAAEAEK